MDIGKTKKIVDIPRPMPMPVIVPLPKRELVPVKRKSWNR